MNKSFRRKIIPRKLARMVRQASSNDDSDINDLLTTSLSELFPEDGRHGKLDLNTSHTIESTDREMSEDENSEYHGGLLRKMISFEQEENNNDRDVEITDESDESDLDQSLNFRELFTESADESDSNEEQGESFAEALCDIDIRNLRKEQRKKVLKSFFGNMKSMKSLVKPVRIPLNNSFRNFPAVHFRCKRRRVSFADIPIFVIEDVEEPFSDESEEYFEEIESTWYNEEDYERMKKKVLKTMEQIVRCYKKKREFVETEDQTAWGLELVTKEMILDRKNYKVASRHAVFDEQEDQRLSHTHDPERIRNVYIEATKRSRDTALEYGWKDQEAIHILNEAPFCINEEDTSYL